MTKNLKTSTLLAGVVLAFGISAGQVVRADTTPPPAPPAAPSTPATPVTPPPAPRLPHYSGSVSGVDATAGNITIKDHKGNESTYSTTATTKIRVHGQKHATLADVQLGWDATVISEDGKTATAIHAGPHIDRPAAAPATPAPATPAPVTPAPTK